MKQAIQAYDQCAKNKRIFSLVVVYRLASWQMLVPLFDYSILTQEFGDIAEIQSKYYDDVIATKSDQSGDNIAGKEISVPKNTKNLSFVDLNLIRCYTL